jgi:NADH:ubiquinone oxidoreductase subunit C
MILKKRYFILSNSIEYLYKLLSNYIKRFRVCNGELEIYLKSKYLSNTLHCLKLHSLFRMDSNSDIVCVDYTYKKYRFKLIYLFLSLAYSQRVKCIISLPNLQVVSIVNFYPGINWVEREVWDLFGIFFNGSEDLRRLLSDYGFKGHALRKDFLLSGYYTLYYNDLNRKLNYITKILTMRESFIYKPLPNYKKKLVKASDIAPFYLIINSKQEGFIKSLTSFYQHIPFNVSNV